MKSNSLIDLFRLDNTVLTFKDICLAWRISKSPAVRSRISYYNKRGELYHLRRGIYAKDQNYNRLELATKIYTPAYISLETVLAQAGIIFQYYSQIFVVSYLTREIVCDGQTYNFKKIRNQTLVNPLGIKQLVTYATATPERAFMDALYLYPNYYFDNLQPLDFAACRALLPIYNRSDMASKLESYYQLLQDA